MPGPRVVLRRDRVRLAFHGPGAAAVLTGLVTNDVAALHPGEGCLAVALTPKGKIVADLRIAAHAEMLTAETGEAAGPGWIALVRKYVNPRLARYTDETERFSWIEVVGETAPTLVHLVTGAAPGTPFHHAAGEVGGMPLEVTRLPDYGVAAFSLAVPREGATAAVDALVAGGATRLDAEGLDALRIRAGFPRWGTDMDDTMLAQEANMDALGAISYTKGCYTGQEFVARLHYRGHVNRHLRGLQLAEPAPRGATVVRMDGTPVGDVRSVAPEGPGAVALAMVRREVEDGTTVSVRWDGGTTTAVVTALPMPAETR